MHRGFGSSCVVFALPLLPALSGVVHVAREHLSPVNTSRPGHCQVPPLLAGVSTTREGACQGPSKVEKDSSSLWPLLC